MARPEDIRYQASHEWAKLEDGVLTLGITDHAVEALGDIVFIDLPDAGTELSKGDTACEIESVKAVGEVYCPVDGTVQAVNESLGDDPAGLAGDPFGDGWLIKIEVSDAAGYEEMLDLAGYESTLEDAE
ncbi:MAG: glycine cleavage system protein GcvH [Planctomycetota bacterium]|jgi:glycine cleavage system H protein